MKTVLDDNHSYKLMPQTSQWEPSTSSGMSRTASDGYVLWKRIDYRKGKRGLTGDPFIFDQFGTVSTPSRISTPELTEGTTTVQSVINRLKLIRNQMESGIEEMKCQIYQIQFCDDKLRQRGVRGLDRPHCQDEKPKRSGCIPCARHTLYESSRSGTDHSPEEYGQSGGSVSPVRSPSYLESIGRKIQLCPFNNDQSKNKKKEMPRLPTPDISAFQIRASGLSTSDESLQGVCRMVDETLLNSSSDVDRSQNSKRRAFKTDVVLNLQGQGHLGRGRSKSTKNSPLDKVFGIFCKKRLSRRTLSRSESPNLYRSKMNRLWGSKSPSMKLPGSPVDRSFKRKFTDKYPIDFEDSIELQQSFSAICVGPGVEFEMPSLVKSAADEQINYVMSADGIANGIACFDVTCMSMSEWCFVGIAAKGDTVVQQERISEQNFSYGWCNDNQCIKNGICSFASSKEVFKSGTNFQIIVNAEAGTLHFRFLNDDSPSTKFVEHEISNLPKNIEWSLAIEWRGAGRFALNSVQAWQ